ncbi:MAG: hypothetical protein ACRC7F_06620 [Cetobacterium sp.]|uniref:hypothetical protein n=1 Tax=unclassified Cetobacterium TaxID=2630983 RepID=UPI000648D52A|nr:MULTISPECIES: hypothetical protein [unclassified Cetobacterium]
MIKKISFFIIFIFFFSGCSSLNSRTVAIDSYSTLEAYPGTYYLVTNTPGFQLQQRVFESNLESMLRTKGYRRTSNPKDALYKIIYNYKINGPYTEFDTYPTTISPYWRGGYGYRSRYDDFFYSDIWINSISASSYFVKTLEVSTYTNEGRAVWQTMGSIKSNNNDLRDSFPYLISAISQYVNVNSNKVVYVSIPEIKN